MIYHLLSSLLFSFGILALTVIIALVSTQCSCKLIMVNKLQFYGWHIECLYSSCGLFEILLSHTKNWGRLSVFLVEKFSSSVIFLRISTQLSFEGWVLSTGFALGNCSNARSRCSKTVSTGILRFGVKNRKESQLTQVSCIGFSVCLYRLCHFTFISLQDWRGT